MVKRVCVASGAVVAGVWSAGAAAHHPMGGATPETFMQGFLSGIGHPIIGLDHLAFVVAVGLLSIPLARRWLMPMFFIVATVMGTGIHLLGVDLPRAELIIAASVLLSGVLLVLRESTAVMPVAALFVVAGVFHGFAYGEAVFGAETSPIVAYLLGFALIQYLIAVAAMQAARLLCRRSALEQAWVRVGGGAIAGVALVFLSEQMMPF
ncbi:MAG: HupE/UreJ family protein [Gammaproteobacteria bacterium]|nr:HupE/UreJ family protein [Gammaproteobacteria bacterium]